MYTFAADVALPLSLPTSQTGGVSRNVVKGLLASLTQSLIAIEVWAAVTHNPSSSLDKTIAPSKDLLLGTILLPAAALITGLAHVLGDAAAASRCVVFLM
jgi:hypothetical protein